MRMKENLQRSFLVGQSRELWRSHFQLRESIEVLSLLLEIIIVSQLVASHETAVPGVDGVDLSSCGAECAVGREEAPEHFFRRTAITSPVCQEFMV